MKPKQETGLRYNKDKLRWSMLPFDALTYLVKVFEYGANKYSPDNWKKGLSYKETFDAALRHLSKWFLREDLDKESNLKHIAHATWNCLALLFFEINYSIYKKFDDRPKMKGK